LLYQDRKEKENPADFDMFNPDTWLEVQK
jgi:hypothetical protein